MPNAWSTARATPPPEADGLVEHVRRLAFTSSGAWPIAKERPATSNIGTSFSQSPTHTVSAMRDALVFGDPSEAPFPSSAARPDHDSPGLPCVPRRTGKVAAEDGARQAVARELVARPARAFAGTERDHRRDALLGVPELVPEDVRRDADVVGPRGHVLDERRAGRVVTDCIPGEDERRGVRPRQRRRSAEGRDVAHPR